MRGCLEDVRARRAEVCKGKGKIADERHQAVVYETGRGWVRTKGASGATRIASRLTCPTSHHGGLALGV